MGLNDLPLFMVRSLFFTILIEVVFSILLKVRDKKDILNVILVNVITNPIVVSVPILVLLLTNRKYQMISFILLEIGAVILEGGIYKKVFKYKKINPYLLSLFLNIASFGLGYLINLM